MSSYFTITVAGSDVSIIVFQGTDNIHEACLWLGGICMYIQGAVRMRRWVFFVPSDRR